MVYYGQIQVIINTPGLTMVILIVVVRSYKLPKSIVSNKILVITSKFWSLLCFSLEIKQKISMTFDLRKNGETEKEHCIIGAYFPAIIHCKRNK